MHFVPLRPPPPPPPKKKKRKKDSNGVLESNSIMGFRGQLGLRGLGLPGPGTLGFSTSGGGLWFRAAAEVRGNPITLNP